MFLNIEFTYLYPYTQSGVKMRPISMHLGQTLFHIGIAVIMVSTGTVNTLAAK